MCEELFRYKIPFYPTDDIGEYETKDPIELRFNNIMDISEKVIEPFIYHKASEVVTEDRSDCVWEFNVDVQFDFEEDTSNLLKKFYSLRYNPINQLLEMGIINFEDYNEDDPILLEYVIVNKYLVNHYYKLKISIEGTCFIESDSSDEEEPPKPIEESFRTDTCVICLDKEPNILFTDCNHICTCSECEKNISSVKCPYCRTEISKRIKIKKYIYIMDPQTIHNIFTLHTSRL